MAKKLPDYSKLNPILGGCIDLSENFRTRPQVTDIKFEIRKRSSAVKRIIKIAENHYKYKGELPLVLKNLFEIADGLSLYWRYRPEDKSVTLSDDFPGGEMNLFPVAKIYSSSTMNILWFEDMDTYGTQGPRYKEFCMDLLLLENLLYSTDYLFIVMTPEWLGKKYSYTDPRILYWNTKGEKYLLTLTINDYFEACLEAKSFMGWQCFYIDKDAMDPNDPFVEEYFGTSFDHAKKKREWFLKEMPILFPELDLRKFRDMHEKLNG